MELLQQQLETEKAPKVYYYFPAHGCLAFKGKKCKHYARRVLAGIVSGNKLYVAESTCFTGNRLVESDQFIKKRGRQIAEGRAWKAVHFEYTKETGVSQESPAAFIVEVPEGTEAVGKFFVQEVEKRYPAHVKKEKKVK